MRSGTCFSQKSNRNIRPVLMQENIVVFLGGGCLDQNEKSLLITQSIHHHVRAHCVFLQWKSWHLRESVQLPHKYSVYTSDHLDLNCNGAEVVLFFFLWNDFLEKSISHLTTIFTISSFASWFSEVLTLKNKRVEKCQPSVFPTVQNLEMLNTPSYITKKKTAKIQFLATEHLEKRHIEPTWGPIWKL